MVQYHQMIEIGQIIVGVRKSKGIGQNALAKRAGMTPAQLCQFEKGRVSPTLRTLERIAAALDMTVVELLGGAGGMSTAEKPETREALPDDYVALRACEPDAAKALKAILPEEEKLSAIEGERGITSACGLALNYAQAKLDGAGEVLAEEVRVALGAGTLPFGDLASCLEYRGVRIYKAKLTGSTPSVSFWNRSRDSLSIVLNVSNTPERDVYRLAYEVGSACLFVSSGFVPLEDSLQEHRFLADFTAAFLMPAVSVRQYVAETGIGREGWSLRALCNLKFRFGVSAEAFALRLEELGFIAPALRIKLRDALRRRYKSRPGDMEPPPHLRPLDISSRKDILKERRKP